MAMKIFIKCLLVDQRRFEEKVSVEGKAPNLDR